MTRSLQVALLCTVGAAAFAVLPGCQNRGNTDTTNAAMPASATTTDHAMVAIRDTMWYAGPDVDHAEKGRIAANSKVWFQNTAATGDLQPAKVDGKVVYVKASDFQPASQP